MFRQIAGRLTGTAVSTVRFATAIPVGVARSVLERVTHHGSDQATPATETAPRQQPPQREPQQQAAQSATSQSGASKRTSTPASTRKKAGTPKAGDVRADDEPDVVLAVDAPPETVEPPVDVVGEALAAEQAEERQKPDKPQPVHVDEGAEVVYSSTSDED